MRHARPPEPYKGKGIRYENERSAARKASPSAAAVDLRGSHESIKSQAQRQLTAAATTSAAGSSGTAERPRLTVFRSSKHIYAQLIDDLTGRDAGVGQQRSVKDVETGAAYGGNVKAAKAVGQKLAEAAKEKGIAKAAFDRGHYRYHGRVKALADGAREGGLQF